MLAHIAAAQVVDEPEARQIAQRFVASSTPDGVRRLPAADAKSVKLAWSSQKGGNAPELYVYNVPSGGFVIVSGDESTESEVLGWSDSGSFNADDLPESLQFLVEGYAKGIAAYRQDASAEVRSWVARAPRRASGYGNVEPLLREHWGQDYSKYVTAKTGCVATAVAQIMNYHRWPQHGYGSHTNVNQTSQSIDFSEHTYQWSKMTSTADADERYEAISRLMADVGCAANMDYGIDWRNASAAYSHNAYKALATHFNYDEGTMQYISNYSQRGIIHYMGTETMADAIRSELRASRPVYYAGRDTIWKEDYIYGQHIRYLDFTEGHALVIDGFSDDGLFHVDFGWDGRCNGYYSLKLIRPYGENDKSASYAPWSEIITGIQPAKREKVEVDGVWYDLDEEAGKAILASSGSDAYYGEVTVPAQIVYEGKTYPVEGMRDLALRERINEDRPITQLTIKAKLGDIPDGLFEGLSTIENVTFAGGVERIGYHAFAYNPSLKSVSITGAKQIDEEAFSWCEGLQSVALGEGVKSVGRAAFANCPALETLTMAEGLDSIAARVFAENEKLTFEKLPASLRYLGDEAFSGIAVERVTIPASVTFGRGVFAKCSNLTEATLEDGLTEVADSLFYQTSLWQLDVPASVTRIGRHAVNSSGLWKVTLHSDNYVIDEGGLVRTGEGTMGVEGLEGCRSIGKQGLVGLDGTFTVNPKTTYAPHAVYGNFDKIIIPAGVTTYDPTSITMTKEYAVDADNPNYVGNGAYLFTKDMKHLLAMGYSSDDNTRIIPTGTETTTAQPLSGFVQYIYLPASLQSIDLADIYSYNLRTVYALSTVPPTFTQYAGAPHDEYNHWVTLHVPQGTAEAYRAAPVWKDFPNILDDLIVEDAFIYMSENGTYATVIGRNTAVKTTPNVMIPATLLLGNKRIPVTGVEDAVFQGDLTIETVKVPAFVYSTPSFKDCTNLRRVTLGEELNDINDSSFENCRALESIDVNSSLRYVGKRAFYGCSSLKTMNLTGADQLGESVFEGCTSLSNVKGLENAYALPNRFFANSGIETFHFSPTNSYSSYNDVFEGCSRLHTLTVDPDHQSLFAVDGILYARSSWSDQVTLLLCPPMERKVNATVGERTVVNVSEKCNYMPSRCLPEGTKEVIIPVGMTDVYMGCGTRAEGLEKVTVLFDNPYYGTDYMFYYTCYANATLQVPKGKKEAFAAHSDWGRFGTIVEIDPDDYPSPEQIARDAQAVNDDETVGTALTLLMKDGTTHTVRLASKPVISIAGSDLSITGLWLSLSLPLSDVVRYTFESYDATGIDEVTDDKHADLDMQGEKLIATGLKAGAAVDVFDLQGRLQRHAVATADGSLSLSLGGLPVGTYVVKVNEITYKIMKR
ncbi:MAG: leucine-rich repeat protein [Alloprevotella sp.]|nr:leucine-rich repeat protein [Alloprevotella sp.]